MKNIVVLGGGSAGWLTAICAKRAFQNDNVTIIESSEIGILGAGEGATPHLIALLDYLDIPTNLFIKKSKATIKNGIKFTNWSQNEKYYHHNFHVNNNSLGAYAINYNINPYNWDGPSISDLLSVNRSEDFNQYNFTAKVSDQNKVPFKFNDYLTVSENSFLNFDHYASFSIHFDARNFAETLSEIGKSRGIKVIDSKLKEVFVDDHQDITAISLENDSKVDVDFIFDCSGFARLLIGKFYNTKWNSYSKYLPMKKAIPFFLETNPNIIPPYTESVAMDYGWMWKIPLQHRYGCGYVYDSDFISDDSAKIEVENMLGHSIDSPRTIEFNPGSYEDVWVNNCLAVGLSSAFVEPLEATSIMQLTKLLQRFFSQKQHIFTKDKKYQKRFNSLYKKETEEVVDFLYFHYITNKENNKFWKDFTINNTMPDTLVEKLYYIKKSLLTNDLSGSVFTGYNYYTVARGNGIVDKEHFSKIIKDNNLDQHELIFERQRDLENRLLPGFIDHVNLLKYFGGL
jgi:tryptophan halogenase